MSSGRLSIAKAAFVVARRDFTAILFGRAFIFFLLGPLFPVAVMVLAGGLGAQIQRETATASIGVAMAEADQQRILAAAARLGEQLGPAMPPLVAVPAGAADDPAALLAGNRDGMAAMLSGTPAAPVLTAPADRLERWRGLVALVAAEAASERATAYPAVVLVPAATSGAADQAGRLRTAQGAQLLLFLLIMLLASMVLSNLVEEKGNKIIEILAAAVPMEAVFLGKLVAMLGISVVGLAVWGGTAALVLAASGLSLADYASPGVGWPMLVALFALYFAMGYLLLGAIFLAVGSLAATVRDVQTLSMPVTMVQILVFFFASLAVTAKGTALEYAAIAFPLSSPFVMLGRAATDGALWPHFAALAWQAAWVVVFVRAGAGLFCRRVMQSGPRGAISGQGWLGRRRRRALAD